MTELLNIHPDTPQPRFIRRVSDLLKQGAVVVLPTDSGYSLCSALQQKSALERIRHIRQLDPKHYFTLFCRDFSEIATVALVDNQTFRFLKAHTPAPMTFILHATREVPRRLLQPSRKTIGIRITQNKILQTLLDEFAEPLMSVSVHVCEETYPFLDPLVLFERYRKQVDLVVGGGVLPVLHTTVVDLTTNPPQIIRKGSVDLAGIN